ncbi:MAG: hypothetical protein LCH98_12470 [Actinobacteria bacterium]|nr:hypothetical protein [Actinomycetota bacterium]
MQDGTVTPRENALMYARHVDNLAQQGRLGECESLAVPFALRRLGEHVLTSATYVLWESPPERGRGRGVDRQVTVAAGGMGATLHIRAAAFSRVGHARRGLTQARAAVASCLPRDEGTMWLTDRGVYLTSGPALRAIDWCELAEIDLVGPGRLVWRRRAVGTAEILDSDWAEFAFSCWARAVRPLHQRYRSGHWLPVASLPATGGYSPRPVRSPRPVGRAAFASA